MHVRITSIVANDGLVLKHQAINSHTADYVSIVLGQFHINILNQQWRALWIEIIFWKMIQLSKGLVTSYHNRDQDENCSR